MSDDKKKRRDKHSFDKVEKPTSAYDKALIRYSLWRRRNGHKPQGGK